MELSFVDTHLDIATLARMAMRVILLIMCILFQFHSLQVWQT